MVLSKFVRNTNSFSIGNPKTAVLVIPKVITEELGLNLTDKKAHFEVTFSPEKKEITYKFIQETNK